MTVRGGLRPVSFANAAGAASTSAIIAATRFERPEAEFVVYETTDGALHVGRGPFV
jgi:hypothetical protein